MGRILCGRNPARGIPCGRNPVGGIPCGRNPVGGILYEESREGGIPCGRNPVWEESHVGGILVGGIPWDESHGRNPMGGIPWEETWWEESHGRNPVGGILHGRNPDGTDYTTLWMFCWHNCSWEPLVK